MATDEADQTPVHVWEKHIFLDFQQSGRKLMMAQHHGPSCSVLAGMHLLRGGKRTQSIY